MGWIWIVAAVIGFLLLLIVIWRIAISRLRRLAERTRDAVVERLGEDDILLLEPTANYFGQRSVGPTQTRGNVCWALTRERIHFEYWVGGQIVEIPLNRVAGIRTAMSFLGKTRGFPLLVVAFTNDRGEEDESAWLFKDIEAVKARVGELIPGNQ